jgi:hypothetical protein
MFIVEKGVKIQKNVRRKESGKKMPPFLFFDQSEAFSRNSYIYIIYL